MFSDVVFAVIFEDQVLESVPLFDKVETNFPISQDFDEKMSNMLSVCMSSPITQGVRINAHDTLENYMQQDYTAMYVDYARNIIHMHEINVKWFSKFNKRIEVKD